MIDNQDGTVIYSKKEVENINKFLNMVFDKITEYQENKQE